MSGLRYEGLFQRLLARSSESDVYSYEGTPCWEWNGARLRRGGYGRISIWRPEKKCMQGYAVHRIMAFLVLGRQLDPDLETLEHACEITWCINPLHLKIATRADNAADMRARVTGRHPRKVFKPLVDPELYVVDRFIRSLPVLRSSLLENSECPF